MRLTAKFLIAITATVAAILGISAWLTIKRESELFDRDLRHDTYAIGWLLAHAYERTAKVDGLTAADAVLRDPLLDRSGMAARWQPVREVPAELREGLSRGVLQSVRHPEAAGNGHLDTYVPLRVAGVDDRVLHLTASLQQEHRYVRATIWRWAAISLLLLCAAAIVVFALGVVLIARPTRALMAKARRVGSGDLGGPVILRQRDELGHLASELNAMTDQLATARDRLVAETAARVSAVELLRHADRLTTVGRMASGIAHELGTPLNVIEGRARMIQTAEVEGEESVDSARIIVEQSRRVTNIVRQMLDFARRGRAERCPAEVQPVVGNARTLLLATARRAGVELEIETSDQPCIATINDSQIVQVLTNLIGNAIQATPPGGRVTISVTSSVATPPSRPTAIAVIALRVHDTGCGFDAAVGERLFEPFFTTKEVGEGTGLGLAVAHGIISDHEGWIDVESEPGKGSTFTVYLPQTA
jgi:two-component system, NtrC family, sensor kinase